jgi:hypothetical protein
VNEGKPAPSMQRAPLPHPRLRRTIPPENTAPTAVRKAPLELFDPYSDQQILAFTRASAIPQFEPAPAGHASHTGSAGGSSKALLVLQLALLSTVGVMVWYMLKILQTSG